MPKIIIKTVGKLPESWQRDGCAMYEDRMKPISPVHIVEMKEGHKGSDRPDEARAKKAEADDLLASLPDSPWVVALDETGKTMTSPAFAELLREKIADGKSPVFLIGGSWGLDQTVRDRADLLLSFGKMTLPHGLARVVLLEQLYRAAMISSGRTYHK